MTNPKWLMGIAMAFVLMTLWSGVTEGVYLGGTDIASKFNVLISMPAPWNPIGIWSWLKNLWDMFWFDYAFFTGDWVILQTIFQCVSLAIVVSYGAMLLPSILSGLRSLVSGFAGLFGLGARV